MANLARNAPCHCGSGKKYKKCCLAKDEAEARSKNPSQPKPWMERPSPRLMPEPPPAPEQPAPPPDLLVARQRDLWQRFEDASYEEQFAIFTAAMDEPDLMDGEMAFDMLHALFSAAGERGESARFDAAVAAVRTTLPEVYQEEAGYLNFWLLRGALSRRDQAALVAVAAEIAAFAPHSSQALSLALNPLAFHGHARLIGAMFATALRGGSDKAELSWYYLQTGLCYATLDALERGLSTSAMLDATCNKDTELAAFPRKELEALMPWLERVAGQPSPPITPQELRGKNAARALNLLGAEFIGYLRRVEQVPYALGRLGADTLFQYVAERLREASEASRAPKRRGHAPAPAQPPLPLWPTRATLEHFLAGHFGSMGWSPYAAVAALEVLPAWLRFLDARGLLPEGREARALDELGDVVADARKVVTRPGEDPALGAALVDWPRPAPAGVRLPPSGDSHIAWDLTPAQLELPFGGSD